MNWEQLIISQKASKQVKETITRMNTNSSFKGKYIGIIPIFWDTLGIFKKNQEDLEKRNDILDLSNKIKDLNLEDETNNDLNIQKIYTTKTHIIINRELYYLRKKESNLHTDHTNMTDNFYPVFKYDDSLTFSLRALKVYILECLKKEGFSRLVESDFDLFRIYKMNGFHLFGIILFKQVSINDLNIMKNDSKIEWVSDRGVELLPLTNKEIINPFMKISQIKFNINTLSKKINNLDIWNLIMKGYLMYDETEEIIPYNIKWSEILATIGNDIDSDAADNINLYFQAFILDTNSDICRKLFNNVPKLNN
jgi:hypothetical protein